MDQQINSNIFNVCLQKKTTKDLIIIPGCDINKAERIARRIFYQYYNLRLRNNTKEITKILENLVKNNEIERDEEPRYRNYLSNIYNDYRDLIK